MQQRTNPCIHLGPTVNLQGSRRFLDLTTWRKLTRKPSFNEKLYLESIIKCVIHKAERDKQPEGLTFVNRHGEDFDWSQEDKDDQNDSPAPNLYPDVLAEHPGLLIGQVPTAPLEDGENVIDLQEQAQEALDNARITGWHTDKQPP